MPTQDSEALRGTLLVKPISRQGRIQAKVDKGLGVAAKYLGAPFKQYRPTDPFDPLASLLGSVMADFDIDPAFSHKAPSKFANAIYYGLFDGTYIMPSDYLIGADGKTYYVAGIEPNKPSICVKCNQVISVLRPNPAPEGDTYYGGDIRGAGETAILSGWPASVLTGTKGERGATNLPGDVRMPWVTIMLPHLDGVTIQTDDRVADDLDRFWTISSAELTDLGWRLTAMFTAT